MAEAWTVKFDKYGGYDMMSGGYIIVDPLGVEVCVVDVADHHTDPITDCWLSKEESDEQAKSYADTIVAALNAQYDNPYPWHWLDGTRHGDPPPTHEYQPSLDAAGIPTDSVKGKTTYAAHSRSEARRLTAQGHPAVAKQDITDDDCPQYVKEE